jgi:UDP-3-O-[3-hydroxymyristoyl] glucosamine N-acyltransferase
MRIAELADRLDAKLIGDGEGTVVAVRPLDQAGPDDLSFLHNPKYVMQARASRAGAILVRDAEVLPGRTVLMCDEPYLALARALELLHPAAASEPGIHASAAVAADADLGEGAAVGPCAVVGPGCRVGARSVIGAGAVLGRGVEVGQDCLLHPRVVVEDGCRIGDRCILNAGVVIGSDGYGFATVAGVHHKVPQVGIVVLEDDVELGANVCVDRATLGETRIGRGTKVDNLVQIAHNVQVGEGCLLVAQVGISGSTRLGHHVVMAGQSGAAGHLEIGDQAVIGAQSGVFKDVPDGGFVSGTPARPQREWMRANAGLLRLDQIRKRLDRVEEAIGRRERSNDRGDDQ